MNKKLLRHLIMLSKLAIYGFVVQLIAFSALTATDLHAQKNESVKNIYLDLGPQERSIIETFSYIEAKTGLSINYEEKDIDKSIKITPNQGRSSVEDILLEIAKVSNLRFRQVNQSINVLNDSKRNKKHDVEVVMDDITITGKVTSADDGEGLPGVNVILKGTTQGTVTDVNGDYKIDVPSTETVLVFSSVGYQKEEVIVGEKTVINMTLTTSIQSLREIVVVGYGTMKKSDLTGSVASVNSEDFVKGVATNALQLLSGKVPGVNINQVNSEPGGQLTIRVRGAGSINSSNNVLIVIDGLPGGDPQDLNPSDIESIEILKDASAAAIYGTRAANGVVLITTKKGTEGTPQVSYNTNWAYQTPSKTIDVLDATQYMQMINDISADGGKPIPYTEAEIAAAGIGTNWQDELLRDAWASNQQVSVKGGGKESNYYVSLGYLNQDGIMVSSGFKKYNVLLNLEANPSDKFKFGLNLNANLNMKDKIADESNSGNENADPLNAALMFDPRLSPKKNENGEYETNPSIALDNPVALAYGYDYREQNNRIYGTTFGEYNIINGLKASVRLGADLNNTRNDQYTDRTTQRGKANGGIGNIESWIQSYWLVEGIINYDRTFGSHHISLMGGSTWEKFDNLYQRSYAKGFLSDVTNTNLLESGNAANNLVNSSKTVHTLQSLIGRLNYTYADKYLLTATIRRDGTSRFSEQNKYAIFPSVAVGWRMSEEPFIKGISGISDLKLRFGYGQMGNEGIGNFETISTFVAGGNTVLGGVELSGAQPARIPNPELTWETTEEFNYGLDFGFLDNRISGSIEYYVKNSIDQLFNKPVPMTTGFSNVRTNFGTVRNSGFDISLITRNLTGDFQWTTSISLSTLKNEVVELPPYVGDIITGGIVANIPGFALVREGYPMQAFYGFKVTGIFQENDDIANSAQPSAKPGEPIFLDADGNGKIDASDRVVLGDPFPDLSYSMDNTFSYKNFSLDIYLLGVQGIQTFNANVLESMFPINFDRNIMTKHYLGRWTPDNPNAEFPSGVNSAVYFGGGKMINNYTIQNASYLRVKNVTLSYMVPLGNQKVFKSIQLSLSGENLFTFTKFDGYDPEANQTGDGTTIAKSSYNNYPLARVYRLGANINF